MKPEARNPKSETRPKPEARVGSFAARFPETGAKNIQISDFGPLSDFADSDFGFIL
jgi:hypothetical protein